MRTLAGTGGRDALPDREGMCKPGLGICKIQEWGSQGEMGRTYAKLLGGSQSPKETRK